MIDKAIVHMDLDSFFVAVERLRDSQLIGKPVIVGGQSDRGVVSACSYETRKFGVRSAMPMKLARQLCPDAIVLRGDYDAYSSHSKMVTDIITENAPVVEKSSIDEFYLDMTGMERYFGTWKFATELRQKIIRETGLSISMALATNKTVSKVATNEVKPARQIQILQGTEKSYLAPLAVSKIPLVGNVTSQTLRNMGVTHVGTLSQMPLKLLEKTFGKIGKTLWERANGIDFTPVIPYHEQKGMSKEMTFQQDTTDVNLLNNIFITMTEQLCYDLRKSGHCTGCISVKVRYSNFDTHTKQLNIPITSADHVLIKASLDLFQKLYDRRLLIRLIGIRFTKLVRALEQLNLFDNSAKVAPLYDAMDRIRDKYGNDAIGRATRIDKRNKRIS